jgi:hypothetical protein
MEIAPSHSSFPPSNPDCRGFFRPASERQVYRYNKLKGAQIDVALRGADLLEGYFRDKLRVEIEVFHRKGFWHA